MERPMVVKDMKEHLLPKFPLMMQPKKDGVRCMVDYDHSAWCRPRKKKPLVQHKPHVQAFIKQHLIRERADGMVFKQELPGPLDGELVIPGESFPNISSGVKGGDSEFSSQLVYPIFDLMIPDMAFACRYALLEDWYHNHVPGCAKECIKLVPVRIVHNMEELEAAQAIFDYTDEGSVIRDPNGHYTFDKSTRAAVRYKYQKDSEFLCVDVVDGKGKDVGVATFVCVTADGKEFRAASTGEKADREAMFTNKHEYIGKWLTLQYQELLPSGKPRFGHLKTDDKDPTFKAVRDREDFDD